MYDQATVLWWPAIRPKRRSLLSKKVLLSYNNTRSHTAGEAVPTITQLGFVVLEPPAYNPGLAPSDYHLFGPLKNAFRGRRINSCRKRYINGYAKSRKPYCREYGSLWTGGTSASKRKETILRKKVLFNPFFCVNKLKKKNKRKDKFWFSLVYGRIHFIGNYSFTYDVREVLTP